MDILVIRNSKRQSVWIIPLLVVSALAGLYLLHESLYPLIAWPLIIIFALGILFLFLSSGEEENRLIINEKGIWDQTLGVGLIPWKDVLDAHVESKYNNHYVCLKLNNSEFYLSKLPEKRRQKMRMSYELGFTRFNINVAGAEADILKILDLIKKMSLKKT